MNFLSIIYLETNSTTSEKISLGLLGVSEKHIFLKYSENKIKIAEKLAGSSFEKLVKFSLNSIKKQISIANNDFVENKLFDSNHQFKQEYITYLSKYAQGLFQFEAPKPYSGELNKNTFEKLFQKFISMAEPEFKKTNFYNEVKSYVKKSAIYEKVDVDYNLDPKLIPSLIAKENVSFISKNGNIMAAQLVDFNSNEDLVKQHIYEFRSIVDSLEGFAKEQISKNHKGNYIMLFNKPEKNTKQEKLLNHLKSLEKQEDIPFKVEESNYIEKIEEKILKEDYQKFSEFAETLEP
ncbi:hypothetical protein MTP09_00650 [Chryseobacterium suipulveris]|uniref:DUF3037 domain-containing protein n=1 Tax=Chryseobacterium suipulveris TaxID=2929800 RepID=A0ABY4BPT7_9FLAO|nr:hypothetical protein [Chryseobacterium suipulveris]UOE41187.1 hypothetical protein MTP09_00650 [Chryseobacterium suipulveris]